jgi:glycosyltransferase involved in cell wall biosynthesis
MQKKIGVLFTHAQDLFLPTSQVHSLLMRYLDRGRLDVHLACTTGTGGEKPPSLKALETIPHVHLRLTKFGPTISGKSKLDIVRSILLTGPPSIANMAGLVHYIKKHNIGVIHTGYRPRDAFNGVLLAKLAGARTIVHVHSVYGDWFGGRVRWAMTQADGIIAISQFVAESLVAAGFPSEKVYCVLNAIDVNIWNYDADGSSIREEFGLTSEVPVLALISRLVPAKGHQLLLAALALVRKQVPAFKLLIVGGEDPGGGSLQDGRPYREVLQETIDNLKLDEHVVFTGPRSDVQQILAASDLFTMPSESEGFGQSFAEAMAMKKPVIALDNAGTPEVVEHGKSGLLSPLGDVQQLAENILTLLGNPALRRQMGEYGRMRVEQYFNAQRMANDAEKVYQLVLKR